jgi:type II secretory pathway component PulF
VLAEAWGVIDEYDWIGLAGLLGIAALVGLLLASSTLRWHLPLVGRLYRMYVQGRVLRMLAPLLEAGRPAPEALGLLADSGYFAGAPRRRLVGARRLVEQGESLATSLRRKRLLPSAMTPLVAAAQRIQNLPWTLTELGENRTNRALRLLQRLSMAVAPFPVIAVGAMVAFIALAIFMPLIYLLGRLGG